jgi:hypothetical protein
MNTLITTEVAVNVDKEQTSSDQFSYSRTQDNVLIVEVVLQPGSLRNHCLIPSKNKKFFSSPNRLELTEPPIQWLSGPFFSWGKRPGCAFGHWPELSSKCVELYLHSSVWLSDKHNVNLTLPFPNFLMQDFGLLGCDAVSLGKCVQTFRRIVSPSFKGQCTMIYGRFQVNYSSIG